MRDFQEDMVQVDSVRLFQNYGNINQLMMKLRRIVISYQQEIQPPSPLPFTTTIFQQSIRIQTESITKYNFIMQPKIHPV